MVSCASFQHFTWRFIDPELCGTTIRPRLSNTCLCTLRAWFSGRSDTTRLDAACLRLKALNLAFYYSIADCTHLYVAFLYTQVVFAL